MFFLQNGPHKAKWLAENEKTFLIDRLAEDERIKKSLAPKHHSFADAFRSPKVWLLCFVYFGTVMGNYGIQFWLPQLVKETLSKDPFKVGLLTMIPWGLGAICMVLVGRHSDKTGERSWHVGLAALAAAIAYACSALPGIGGIGQFIAVTIALSGIVSASSTFWSLPTAYLSGTAASAGIALINSLGNLAGYVGPSAVGKIRDLTHSMTGALLMLSCSALMSAIISIGFFRKRNQAHA
jgi:nitrate/nitrite transporter NarK